MRLIIKQGTGNHQLDLANHNPPTTANEAKSCWKSFGYKPQLTQILSNEQYGLCAYSEIRPDLEGLGTHIEHIQPKNQFPMRTFDYANLVLSALSSDDLSQLVVSEAFAGHAKGNNYDVHLFISCLQPGCARYFAYLSNGRVEPAITLNEQETEQAQYTINLLNLNSPYLVNRRKRWLDELDSLIDEHIENNYSLSYLAAIDLLPTSGKLSPFFSATRQRFGELAASILG